MREIDENDWEKIRDYFTRQYSDSAIDMIIDNMCDEEAAILISKIEFGE